MTKILFKAWLIAILTGLQFASAADAPKPESVESLKAENELLKANLAQLRLEFQYQMQVCQAPDLTLAKAAAIQAQKKTEEVKKAEKAP